MSEWQTETNVFGGTRRYRIVNGVKEYETEVITSSGTYTKSQIEAGKTAKQGKYFQDVREDKRCPFNSGGGLKLCRRDCAFWSDKGCMESTDTKGKKCPIGIYECTDKCKLYDSGCKLFRK